MGRPTTNASPRCCGDALPAVLLTTADTAAAVAPLRDVAGRRPVPVVLEIDTLDLTIRRRSTARRETRPTLRICSTRRARPALPRA